MSRYVRDSAAGKSIKAIVIMKGKRHIATVQAHYGNSRVLVNVWHDDGTPMQSGSASGYGYDKFTSALSGLTIDGHIMTNHYDKRLKPPKALGYFPIGWKVRRGYSPANYGKYDANGKRWDNIDIRLASIDEIPSLTPGYATCYRDSGLDYLRALGYSVINAI